MTTALGLLPYVGLVLLVGGFARAGSTASDAVARGSVAFGVVLLMGTEALSAVHAVARGPVAVPGVIVVLLAISLAAPALLRNDTRPLLPLRDGVLARPREAGYVAGREMLAQPYRRVLDDLDAAGCARVLLATLWALSHRRGSPRTFRQSFVANASAVLEHGPPADACALVAIDRPETWRPDGAWTVARLRWRDGPVALWDAP